MKEKVFKIYYSFDGRGYVFVEAKSRKEAEEIFNDGGWVLTKNDSGDNYQILEIEEA